MLLCIHSSGQVDNPTPSHHTCYIVSYLYLLSLYKASMLNFYNTEKMGGHHPKQGKRSNTNGSAMLFQNRLITMECLDGTRNQNNQVKRLGP